jgi:tRNA nucleotidyltransferase (CCA-adding enzyme)
MTTTRVRQPKGIPVGGQFATTSHTDPGFSLERTAIIPDLIDVTPETQEVLDALRAAGGRPLIVGGAVRDALLSHAHGEAIAPKDIDIEVYGLSRQEVFAALPGDAQEFGQDFGVFNTSLNGQAFDVALPRRDNKTGEGYRGFVVETDPNLDFETAFSRRDFTINAMGWDAESGELVDPLGGRADLEAGILRHTGDKFQEDPLRVLRGVQFAARFNMELHPDTADLCREMAPAFHELKPSGVWSQFHKLSAKGTHISKGLEALHATGWEQHFPSLSDCRDVPQDPRWHPEGAVHVHLGLAGDAAARIARRDGLNEEDTSILVLAAISHDFGKAVSTAVHDDGSITSHDHHHTGVEPTRAFLDKINAPSVYYAKILPLVREHMSHSPGGEDAPPPDTAVRRLVRRLDHAGGGPTLKEWTRIVEADKGGRGDGPNGGPEKAAQWLAIAERIDAENPRSMTLLKGHHLAASGVPRGPLWAFMVAQSEEAQDNGAFTDEDGAQVWLQANQEQVVAEAKRRRAEAQAAFEIGQREKLAIQQARQAQQKAEARALKEAARAAT